MSAVIHLNGGRLSDLAVGWQCRSPTCDVVVAALPEVLEYLLRFLPMGQAVDLQMSEVQEFQKWGRRDHLTRVSEGVRHASTIVSTVQSCSKVRCALRTNSS